MFGADILVCPKVVQKFINPDEVVLKKVQRKVVMEVKNEGDLPIYEVLPMFPESYYDWNTKMIREPGQYQLFLNDQEIPMFIKAGTVLPLLNLRREGEVAKSCLSLTDCYDNSVTLQIYVKGGKGGQADGLWYIDDGISEGVKGPLYQLSYKNEILWITQIQAGDKLFVREISFVEIYGENELKLRWNEGEPITGGQRFSVELSTSNLKLLESVPLIEFNK